MNVNKTVKCASVVAIRNRSELRFDKNQIASKSDTSTGDSSLFTPEIESFSAGILFSDMPIYITSNIFDALYGLLSRQLQCN